MNEPQKEKNDRGGSDRYPVVVIVILVITTSSGIVASFRFEQETKGREGVLNELQAVGCYRFGGKFLRAVQWLLTRELYSHGHDPGFARWVVRPEGPKQDSLGQSEIGKANERRPRIWLPAKTLA